MAEQSDPFLDTTGRSLSEQSDLIVESIVQALGEPKMVSGDAGTFENPSISELIASHKYVSSLNPDLVANPLRAIRFAKFRPPGAV